MQSRLLFVTMTVLGLLNLSPFARELRTESTDLSSQGPSFGGGSGRVSKGVSALAGSQKVSTNKFNEVLPKPRVRKPKPATKTVRKIPAKAAGRSNRVSVSFDGAPPPAAAPETRENFYAKVRDSKAGRSALPMNVEESTPASSVVSGTPAASPSASSPQIVINNYHRPRRSSESWSEDEPTVSTRESEPPVTYRMAARSRSRSSGSRWGVALIPFGGLSYTQADVQGTFSDSTSGFTQTTDISGKPGFSAGVLMDIGESTFSVQTGLIYIQEGAKVKISGRDYYGDPYSVNAELSANMIGVPLLLKINTGHAGQTRFSFKGGIIPVYATNVDLKSTSNYIDGYGMAQSSAYGGSSDTDLRRFNVLGQVGAGLIIPIDETLDFRIDGLFNRSLMTLSDGASKENMYTQSFMSIIGFGIHL